MNVVGLGMVTALALLVVGGCAASTATTSPAASDATDRAPDPATPSNFASPNDLLQRYPTMRRQQL